VIVREFILRPNSIRYSETLFPQNLERVFNVVGPFVFINTLLSMVLLENQSSEPVEKIPRTESVLKKQSKSLLKKKSSFVENSQRQSTGRRLSFSDDNGGNLAKVCFYFLKKECFSIFVSLHSLSHFQYRKTVLSDRKQNYQCHLYNIVKSEGGGFQESRQVQSAIVNRRN